MAARNRKRSIAQTVTNVADALTSAALEALTPEQRSSLTSADTGTIIHLAIDFATKVGSLLEDRAKGATDGR